MALNILGDKIDALVDMTIVYPDGVPDYGDFWLGDVPRIAVDLRQIDIPDWVVGGNYEDDPVYRERFQNWVDQVWTEKDQLITEMNPIQAIISLGIKQEHDPAGLRTKL